jgi:prefoldin subunit 5
MSEIEELQQELDDLEDDIERLRDRHAALLKVLQSLQQEAREAQMKSC